MLTTLFSITNGNTAYPSAIPVASVRMLRRSSAMVAIYFWVRDLGPLVENKLARDGIEA